MGGTGGIGIAVVGVKGMGKGHIEAIKKTPGLELRGVCDVVEAEAKAAGEAYKVAAYTDHAKMLEADEKIRAVAIATPHWFHPKIAIDCAKRKVHVLTEKPMSVTVGDADKMIAAHKKAKTILAVVYQHRFAAMNAMARKMVQEGQLGKIHRILLIETCCRSNAYYASGAWRATWRGEGGGVLLNQAPHALDMLQWITGLMPKEIYALNETAMHKIEVEDRASALLRYAGGAVGYLHVSTTETPNQGRIEIFGDKGLLAIEGEGLRFAKLDQPMSEFIAKTDKVWGRPQHEWADLTPTLQKPEKMGHEAVFADFAEAIANKRPPLVTGPDGRNSVELANAMILSSQTGKPVKLPVSRAAYERLIKKLVAKSKKRS